MTIGGNHAFGNERTQSAQEMRTCANEANATYAKQRERTSVKKFRRHWFLRWINVQNFGSLHDEHLGPFGPGLNVVFGPNGSGKTTLRTAVKGVLFGWQQARSGGNTYKSEEGQRAASLSFENYDTGDHEEVARSAAHKPEDTPFGEELCQSIDAQTFNALFSLDALQLDGLADHTELATKLHSAESGTDSSPVNTLHGLQKRIRELTSNRSRSGDSIPALQVRFEDMKLQGAQLAAEADELREKQQELKDLQCTIAQLEEEITRIDAALEGTVAVVAEDAPAERAGATGSAGVVADGAAVATGNAGTRTSVPKTEAEAATGVVGAGKTEVRRTTKPLYPPHYEYTHLPDPPKQQSLPPEEEYTTHAGPSLLPAVLAFAGLIIIAALGAVVGLLSGTLTSDNLIVGGIGLAVVAIAGFGALAYYHKSAQREDERLRTCDEWDLSDAAYPPTAPTALTEQQRGELIHQRKEHVSQLLALQHRVGALEQELASAAHNEAFNACKQITTDLQTQLEHAKEELVELIIAQAALTEALELWEIERQPRVYEYASQLFALMTQNEYCHVRTTVTDQLEVVDAYGRTHTPQTLSLGTRHQLYLALRLALLREAPEVSPALPMLCDDILVHFDAERRNGAIKALCDLANVRQVIIFTCHKEVAQALCAEDPAATYLTL